MLVSLRARLIAIARCLLPRPVWVRRSSSPVASVAQQALGAEAGLLGTKVSATAVELETSTGFVRVTMPLPDVFRLRLARQRAARGLPSLAVVPELAGHEQPLSVEE